MLCVWCTDGSGCERVDDIEVEDWESEERQETGNPDAMPEPALKDSIMFESKNLFGAVVVHNNIILFLSDSNLCLLLPSGFCRSSSGQ